eukprot:134590_1
MQSPSVVLGLLATPQSRVSIEHAISHGYTPQSDISQTSTIDNYISSGSTFARYGGFIALFGGFLVQLTLGSLFTFGNLVSYISSYMTYNEILAHNNQLTDDEIENIYNSYVSSCNIILFVCITADALCNVFGGDIEIYIGPTKTILAASLCITFGFGLTYVGLIYHNIYIVAITFGLFGCGVGIGYPVQPIVCMRWFPMRRGLVNGIISAVFGSGPFVFDAIQSKLVNPENVAINDSYGYSKNTDILQRIPFMFAYVACIMFTMQLISIMCVKNPPWFITINQEDGGGDEQTKSKTQLRYEANSLSVKESMSYLAFWELWTANFIYTIVLMWLTASWKLFAVSYIGIHDDQLLAVIGSLSSLSNGIGRFVWGVIYDWSQSFRISMGLQTAICATFVITLPFILYLKFMSIEGLFTFWMIIMWFCAGCEYAFLPSCIAETFGALNTGAIIGVFVMAEPMAMGIVVLLSSMSFLQNNYEYYCIIVGLCCGIASIISVFYKPNRIDRSNKIKGLKKSIKMAKKYNSVDDA